MRVRCESEVSRHTEISNVVSWPPKVTAFLSTSVHGRNTKGGDLDSHELCGLECLPVPAFWHVPDLEANPQVQWRKLNSFVNDEEKGGLRGDGKGYLIGLRSTDRYIAWRMAHDIRWTQMTQMMTRQIEMPEMKCRKWNAERGQEVWSSLFVFFNSVPRRFDKDYGRLNPLHHKISVHILHTPATRFLWYWQREFV